jgi:hypothetical protein
MPFETLRFAFDVLKIDRDADAFVDACSRGAVEVVAVVLSRDPSAASFTATTSFIAGALRETSPPPSTHAALCGAATLAFQRAAPHVVAALIAALVPSLLRFADDAAARPPLSRVSAGATQAVAVAFAAAAAAAPAAAQDLAADALRVATRALASRCDEVILFSFSFNPCQFTYVFKQMQCLFKYFRCDCKESKLLQLLRRWGGRGLSPTKAPYAQWERPCAGWRRLMRARKRAHWRRRCWHSFLERGGRNSKRGFTEGRGLRYRWQRGGGGWFQEELKSSGGGVLWTNARPFPAHP